MTRTPSGIKINKVRPLSVCPWILFLLCTKKQSNETALCLSPQKQYIPPKSEKQRRSVVAVFSIIFVLRQNNFEIPVPVEAIFITLPKFIKCCVE
jgi:hypothetical protein